MTHLLCVGREVWAQAAAWRCLREIDGAWSTYRGTSQPEPDWAAYRYTFFLHWSDYVPPRVLAATEAVNFHVFGPPVEPMVWHRGGNPIENLLLRGYTETMVGAHRMTAEWDAGDIYGLRGPISLRGTKAQILARCIDPVVDLIRWIVAEQPVPMPQQGEAVQCRRLPPGTEVPWLC